jgi:hypothetical protein
MVDRRDRSEAGRIDRADATYAQLATVAALPHAVAERRISTPARRCRDRRLPAIPSSPGAGYLAEGARAVGVDPARKCDTVREQLPEDCEGERRQLLRKARVDAD